MVGLPLLELSVRALVWLIEDTWRSTVAAATAVLPADAQVTLLYVAASDAEGVVEGTRAGLLGRPRPPHGRPAPLRGISEEAARGLLADAEAELGRPARGLVRRGRLEREVLAAARQADLLVMARDGDRSRLGPRSLGPHARFVVDHAPCSVLLVWPGETPALSTIPPPPRH